MPVPLNAFVDVSKIWFTERLNYLVNDSIPVKPAYKGKAATPSDIDLICKDPREKRHSITFDSRRKIDLSPNLLVECKGWFDYSKTEFANLLISNLMLLKNQNKKFLPQSLPPPKQESHLFFFREEVFNEGYRRFESKNFQRVVIGPFLILPKRANHSIPELISAYESYDIVIIEIQDILSDLFKFIQSAMIQRKEGVSSNYMKLRKTYTLEMLHLVNTFFELKRKSL